MQATDLTRPQQQFNTLRDFVKSTDLQANLQAALPEHMKAAGLARAALTAISLNPPLLNCTQVSLGLALLKAAQLGVEPNGRDAHLVPYGNECQLIVDYKGLVQLAYQSGQVQSYTARAVHKKDVFEYEFGSNEHIKHIPSDDDDPGELTHAWSQVIFKGGGSTFVVLNKRQVMQRKAMSKTKRSDSPWLKWPESMWAKSAARELSKWAPQTKGLERLRAASEHLAEVEGGSKVLDASFIGLDESQIPGSDVPSSKAQGVRDRMDQKQPPQQQPDTAPPSDEQAEHDALVAGRQDEFRQSIAGAQEESDFLALSSALDHDDLLSPQQKGALRRQVNAKAQGPGQQGEMFDGKTTATEAGQ